MKNRRRQALRKKIKFISDKYDISKEEAQIKHFENRPKRFKCKSTSEGFIFK
jgi:hypothetical protein